MDERKTIPAADPNSNFTEAEVRPTAEVMPPSPFPIPPTPTLLEIGRERLEALRALVGQYRKMTTEPDVEFVHDLRVQSRRLAALVNLLEDLLSPAVGLALRDTLRQTRQIAGELRDLDVLTEHLEHGRFPAGLKPLRKHLLAELPPKRTALLPPLQQQLTSAGLGETFLLLAGLLESPEHHAKLSNAALDKVLNKRLRQRAKKLRKAFGKATLKQTPTALHQARIAAKKYRYALELAAESGLCPAEKQLKFLKKIQTHLGQMHDTEVIMETLGETLASLQAPPPTTTDNLEDKVASKSLRGLLKAWKVFTKMQQQVQARRAAAFFADSYRWMNFPGLLLPHTRKAKSIGPTVEG